MNYSFIIRKATIEDAPAIATIIQESFKKYMQDTGLSVMMDALTESIDTIEADIAEKEVYIALIDNNPVGTIRIKIMPDKSAYISRFGVMLDYHNIGIGKSLMNLADKILMHNGVKKVSLHTASKYRDLIRFYYGRGFYIESTSTDRGYIRALLVKEYI
ncbi:GCN5-related N-acetyltransferase [Ruminiclostridium papyrosolvens DSM 2782]|uniref:GCN5-related N-acetyltransferase n=1 Tax=Ruminiclostridium papyrosolvens DSM 2782 TaxID=588581 RepID=F1TGS7_9FIRM|nr:GNAT family N-acetyltransferase [Ruminiclostridium papyrosolvens]EGD46408.1 GCN5-related N-acetyltransferase [Ruminiclostridium papyrosolvens DSM 2782]WES33979.1 GNAT family N-acetyltransferase [Ruminiclostridium papyrosolvens DSM 2782]